MSLVVKCDDESGCSAMIRRIRDAIRTARDVARMAWYLVGAFVAEEPAVEVGNRNRPKPEPTCKYCEVAESDCICKGGPRT